MFFFERGGGFFCQSGVGSRKSVSDFCFFVSIFIYLFFALTIEKSGGERGSRGDKARREGERERKKGKREKRRRRYISRAFSSCRAFFQALSQHPIDSRRLVSVDVKKGQKLPKLTGIIAVADLGQGAERRGQEGQREEGSAEDGVHDFFCDDGLVEVEEDEKKMSVDGISFLYHRAAED